MRDLFTEEKVILGILSERWVLNLYDLYQTEELSAAQIAQFVRLYEENGYIKKFGLWIIKTIKGYIKIKEMAPDMYRMSDNSWKQVPQGVFKEQVEVNKPIRNLSFKDIK